jgi:5-formyltetrahydrofolate cyclo-ligase
MYKICKFVRRGSIKLTFKVKPKNKQELRERILTLLRRQKKDKRLENSRKIRKKLFAMQEFKESKVILFYASFGGEVETFEMMKLAKKIGKIILLPKIDSVRKKIIPVLIRFIRKDLKKGVYGIKEPKETTLTISLKDIDMVVVPGVAFDKRNNRLGRGGGYYDRFIKRLSAHTTTVGLAFDFQLLSTLPHTEKHDARMHYVLTN